MIITVLILLTMMLPAITAAETLRVQADRGGEFATIQAALDAAAPGDTVTLGAGTYAGPGNTGLDFRGKTLRLVGNPDEPRSRIIDPCAGTDGPPARAFFFHTGETSEATVSGITVTGGVAPGRQEAGGMGGAVLCAGSSPTLADCLFERNWAHTGGAIALENSSARITGCRFVQNTGEIGGAVSISGGEPVIAGCTFLGNTAAKGGALAGFGTRVRVDQTFLNANSATQGGAVALDQGAQMQLTGSLLSNNFASFGGGIYVRGSNLACERVTLVHNAAGSGGALHLAEGAQTRVSGVLLAYSIRGGAAAAAPGAALTAACTLIFGNAGGDWTGTLADQAVLNGNLQADPQLEEPEMGRYAPRESSPCRTAACGVIGALE